MRPLKKRTFVRSAVLCVGCLTANLSLLSNFAAVHGAEPTVTKTTSQALAGKVDAKLTESLSRRFAAESVKETPDFRKHVVPLLGRLGCNGRACHGSFQGRGDFRLSLFGYDFAADHQALLDEGTGRVDVEDVVESLMLANPLDADIHEGGKRFDQGSWQHHVLRRWIESGAKYDTSRMQTLVRLEVTPAELRFSDADQTTPLIAIAHWQDGTVEDVTEICRFSSNDDAIADIDDAGHVRSGQRGDTHVVVYYDNAVVPIPVIQPIGSPRVTSPEPAKAIDRLVQQKLDKLGIKPAGPCADAEFIRRVSLDITGILPSSGSVRDFLADDSADKRDRLIDRLIDSPGYSAWWATRFSDWTGNSEVQLNNVLPVRNAASRLWYQWLRTRIDSNVPYDKLVEGIVTAKSREPGESYTEYCRVMTSACEPGNEELFAEREGLPMFWGRRNFQKPEDRAIGFAYTFLGVRIECAQCHKHPFDRWSKDDFLQFSTLFSSIRVNQNVVAPESKDERIKLLEAVTGGKKLKGGELRRAVAEAASQGKAVPFGELTVNIQGLSKNARKRRALAKKQGRRLGPAKIRTGKILGAETIAMDKDPRDALMSWLRSPDNPYFAKAIVNRVWSNYFGIGIVDPTDDMNLANPPSNAPLLDYLSTEFIRHDFDLKWLHHEIVTSETYQRSAKTNATNVLDQVNFSRHVPRRLPAEVIYDAVVLATGSDKQSTRLRDELDQMAIADGKPRRRNQQDYALQVFGQSIRESNCDCDRSDSPSLLQSIYLRNDADMHKRLSDLDGWVAQACQALGVDGPKPGSDPKQVALQRRAAAQHKQFVKRLQRYRDLPENRREKTYSQLELEYKKLVSRMKRFGHDVPPLEKLVAEADAWPTLKAESAMKPASKTLVQVVEEAYLRALSRYPDDEEVQISVTFIDESKTPAAGVQSLLWALVNTKEFIITH